MTRSGAATRGPESARSPSCPTSGSGRSARWRKLNRRHQRIVRGRIVPDPNAELFLYQTLVGIWPAPRAGRRADDVPDKRWRSTALDRLQQYMLKAVREAKLRTTWTEPDEAYEAALARLRHGVVRIPGRRSVPVRRGATRVARRRPSRNGARCRACCSISRYRARRTSIRATSCGTSRSSIRTIGGRWTTRRESRPSDQPRSSGIGGRRRRLQRCLIEDAGNEPRARRASRARAPLHVGRLSTTPRDGSAVGERRRIRAVGRRRPRGGHRAAAGWRSARSTGRGSLARHGRRIANRHRASPTAMRDHRSGSGHSREQTCSCGDDTGNGVRALSAR